MLFSSAILSSILAVVSSVTASTVPRSTAGINAPTSGAAIAPGQAFDFSYSTMADYSVSSYNYSVWLVTSPPTTAFTPSANFADGWYFGRFSEENYPAIPYPPNNPAPAQLVMPNFGAYRAGWSPSENATNAQVYLAVLEEWSTGPAVLGNRISLSTVQLVYNGTTS